MGFGFLLLVGNKWEQATESLEYLNGGLLLRIDHITCSFLGIALFPGRGRLRCACGMHGTKELFTFYISLVAPFSPSPRAFCSRPSFHPGRDEARSILSASINSFSVISWNRDVLVLCVVTRGAFSHPLRRRSRLSLSVGGGAFCSRPLSSRRKRCMQLLVCHNRACSLPRELR